MLADDPVSLALKLAPHSVRLRAFLDVLRRNGQRTRTRGDAFSRLPQLVGEVLRELGLDEHGQALNDEAGDLPADEPRTFREAVSFMRDRAFLRSASYQAKGWEADRVGAEPRLVQWVGAVVRDCEVMGVPIVPRRLFVSPADQARLFVTGESQERPGESPHNSGRAVELVHGVRGRQLPASCWGALSGVGFEAAKLLEFEVEWGGDRHPWSEDGNRPWQWVGAGFGGEQAPLEAMRRSRSPPGEREALAEHYGLKLDGLAVGWPVGAVSPAERSRPLLPRAWPCLANVEDVAGLARAFSARVCMRLLGELCTLRQSSPGEDWRKVLTGGEARREALGCA